MLLFFIIYIIYFYKSITIFQIENIFNLFIIGNIKLADLTFEQLNNRHVCNLHFKPSDFNNINTQQRLKSTAVPIKYDFSELTAVSNNSVEHIPTSFESPNLHVKTPIKVYNKKPQRTPIESPHLPATLIKTPSSSIYEYSPSTNSMVKTFIDMPSPVSTGERLHKVRTTLFPNEPSPETSKKQLKEVIKKKKCIITK